MTDKKTIGIYGNSLQKARKQSANALYNILHSRGHEMVIFDVDEELSQGAVVPREYRFADVDYGPLTPDQVEEQFPRVQADSLDVILFRRDPPNDAHTIDLMTSLYPHAQYINSPQIIKDMDKKYMQKIAHIDSSFVPETYFSSNPNQITEYISQLGETILKPLNDLGGNGIRKVTSQTDSLDTILADMTANDSEIVVQKFMPEVSLGDKRVIYMDGEVMGQYNRIPPEGEYIANLAQNGTAHDATLTNSERDIIKTITPTLRRDGIYFAGLDFIGDKLTEINVANPGFSHLIQKGHVHVLASELEGIMNVQPKKITPYSLFNTRPVAKQAAQYTF